MFPFLAVCTLINLIMSRSVLIHLLLYRDYRLFSLWLFIVVIWFGTVKYDLRRQLPTIVSLGRSPATRSEQSSGRSTYRRGDDQAADRRRRPFARTARSRLSADPHGVPAADFSADELLYLPRNIRAHRLYGMSPVEQIALTVNIALRRDAATLDYYRAGSSPDAFATLPKEWTIDQIRQFQDYFDALMSGNSARRRMIKFMPSDFRLKEARQPPLKDQYDEWLARIICYAFSVPVSPFVSQVNRATSETLRLQATQEGLVPLKAWVKNALDQIIQVLGEPASNSSGSATTRRPAATGADAQNLHLVRASRRAIHA